LTSTNPAIKLCAVARVCRKQAMRLAMADKPRWPTRSSNKNKNSTRGVAHVCQDHDRYRFHSRDRVRRTGSAEAEAAYEPCSCTRHPRPARRKRVSCEDNACKDSACKDSACKDDARKDGAEAPHHRDLCLVREPQLVLRERDERTSDGEPEADMPSSTTRALNTPGPHRVLRQRQSRDTAATLPTMSTTPAA